MFKALNLQTDEEVIILSPGWKNRIPLLRSLAHQDLLACPACQQPVRVKAGRYKRPHFAHKHLENCPYQSESPLLVNCRALLYEWLVSQFGGDRVNLEVNLAHPTLQRPADCVVSAEPRPFVYWIIERRLPPHERDALQEYVDQGTTIMNWIFVSDMLHTDRTPNRLFLTTTERAFMSHSCYDEIYMPSANYPGVSLHYLDADNKGLTTYRGLRLVHPPQVYKGEIERHPLSIVRVSQLTGEPVHPQETERLASKEAERLRHDKMVQDASGRFQAHYPRRWADQRQQIEEQPSPASDPFTQREAVCMFCGTKTSDWWYLNPADGKCKCRACLRKGIG
jgi:hypothetical protein